MRKERRVQSEKQEPHTAMWGKTKAQHTERVGGKSVVSRSCWGSERSIKSALDHFRRKLMCRVEGPLEVPRETREVASRVRPKFQEKVPSLASKGRCNVPRKIKSVASRAFSKSQEQIKSRPSIKGTPQCSQRKLKA